MSILSTNNLSRVATVLCAIVAIGVPVGVSAQAANSTGGLAAPAQPSIASSAATAAAPLDKAKPFEAFSNSAHNLRDSIVALAKAQIGSRYKRGGTTPKGFDCSGLIKYIMAALDLDVPRTARQQATVGFAVNKDTSRLLPGDVLTFGKKEMGVSHVGIYIGDGKYIHASSKAGKVIESNIDRPASPLIKMWKGARRMLSSDDSVSALTVAAKGGGSN
ncbi:MAG TPA: C40 family peptidase [Gemmatimonadaceae bacterium]|jgi:cell wall-associated NlpC family hydrolase|nr:C40 family peptidase [Gemmatimonadaceae bacterium]